ncbi:PD-(D/E)XK nuclease family protein [Ramlibacter sp. H39-3-26]|uniref:PD-(D/E)XK nuclease family protein n=1 Tax=Curvibacter soli TaxID=3031331 RepID=UPI0023DA0F07|nr:PD-(D/E)XK nuclease family protein [Ramlibacter sp. H39-3-26]MDF1483824.1 PD-(D/E)XK nuclease family protein [Ramlibacter sp. H39-3-26]
MDPIAKTHGADGPAHPAQRRWCGTRDGIVPRIAQALAARGIHAAHAVVLLPYTQLMPAARHWWALARPDGFAPRFETTLNWARRLGAFTPAGSDLAFDAARDLLTAQSLLEQAGLQSMRHVLAAPLAEAAQQLGRRVAAIAPHERAAWAVQARAAVALGLDAQALAYEAALARIALEWALASGYATDVLFDACARDVQAGGAAFLAVLRGVHAEPLAQALQALWGECAIALPLADAALGADAAAWRLPALHAAQDAEDEAQRAAACVLRHVAAGRAPVALAATDRALTRRIRAMLDASGVALRDESGWKVSTTRAAAHVMLALRAAARHASGDAVLDWLKNAPAWRDGPALDALERTLRRYGVRDWAGWRSQPVRDGAAALAAQADAQRATLQGARPLAAWLAQLRAVLQATGQWPLLRGDVAGQSLLQALPLDEEAQAAFALQLEGSPWAARRIDLAEFTAWVNGTLEAASFVPEYPAQEQVAILPLGQMIGRPFAAAVLPGCDERRLPAAPEPPGAWTAAQRAALGLPDRAALQAEARAAWCHALQTPHCDVLWRGADDGGEALLPSPLVQELQLRADAAALPPPDDPRGLRAVPAAPTLPPGPDGSALVPARLSASAYEDLRRCPYRFFALRMLGLAEAEELDAAVDKRDFGLWLHAVLRIFHEGCRGAGEGGGLAPDAAALDGAAERATAQAGLSPEEFLPFAAAWPRVRDGYLDWLARRAADPSAPRFDVAEAWREQPLGPLTLVGQIDRVDRLPGGEAVLIDYKTESPERTRERVRDPLEDTQLAFYAALLPDDTLQAQYLNVGERGGTAAFAQPGVLAARDALVEGMLGDMARIAGGAPLRALGEGAVCEYCAARGLCRKDFWLESAGYS